MFEWTMTNDMTRYGIILMDCFISSIVGTISKYLNIKLRHCYLPIYLLPFDEYLPLLLLFVGRLLYDVLYTKVVKWTTN